jgi:hypothetical protein
MTDNQQDNQQDIQQDIQEDNQEDTPQYNQQENTPQEMNYKNQVLNQEQNMQVLNKNKLNNNTLFNYLKNSIFVIAIIFLLSLPVFNLLLKKIPKSLDLTNQPTMIGNVIKSLLGGLLFFILEKIT